MLTVYSLRSLWPENVTVSLFVKIIHVLVCYVPIPFPGGQ